MYLWSRVQIQPRKHALDHADRTAPTRQHESDHTDLPERFRSSSVICQTCGSLFFLVFGCAVDARFCRGCCCRWVFLLLLYVLIAGGIVYFLLVVLTNRWWGATAACFCFFVDGVVCGVSGVGGL